MEPPWLQRVAISGKSPRPVNRGNKRNPLPPAATGCLRRYGKEGVDGSSPSEGFAKFLLISPFCLPGWRRVRASASTERPPRAAIAFEEAAKRCW
jgi:hypothetical protein